MLTDAECRPQRLKALVLEDPIGCLEKRSALGGYPNVDLKLTRKARDDSGAQKSDGHDPV